MNLPALLIHLGRARGLIDSTRSEDPSIVEARAVVDELIRSLRAEARQAMGVGGGEFIVTDCDGEANQGEDRDGRGDEDPVDQCDV